MYPLWAHAYSHRMMTSVCKELQLRIPTSGSPPGTTLAIVLKDNLIFIDGTAIGCTPGDLREFLDENMSKFAEITITRGEDIYKTYNDLNKPRSRTQLFKKDVKMKKEVWLYDVTRVPKDLETKGGTNIKTTVEAIQLIKNNKLTCVDLEGVSKDSTLSRKKNVFKIDNKYIVRVGNNAAFVSRILETEETGEYEDVEVSQSFLGSGKFYINKTPCIVNSDRSYDIGSPLTNLTGKFKNFIPTPYQVFPLRHGGRKMLLAHNPGFGKTINAILIAERMRSYEDKKILIVAPNATIMKQWVDTVHALGYDINNYIWNTYAHFQMSQGNHDYPDYDSVGEADFKSFREYMNSYFNKAKYSGEYRATVNYKKDQEAKVTCKHCGSRRSLADLQKSWGDTNTKEYARLEQFFKNGITHYVFLDYGKPQEVKFVWNLHDDYYLYHCGCKSPNRRQKYPRFITGFTPDESEYGKMGFVDNEFVELDNYKTFKKQFKKNEQTKDLRYYFAREQRQYETFIKERDTILEVEVQAHVDNPEYYKPKGLNNSAIQKDQLPLHQYRAPKGCILICDEIHREVKTNIKITMQSIWKYSLGTKYTLFLTATPLVGDDERVQLHLYNQMLKMNPDVCAIHKGVKYTGLPPWHSLIYHPDITSTKNIFEISRGLGYKFSRFNTVENVDTAISQLDAKLVGEQFKKSFFALDKSEILTEYFGSKVKKFWVDPAENGKSPANLTPGLKEKFTRQALKNIYLDKKLQLENVFPDLITLGTRTVEIDEFRTSLYTKAPVKQFRLEYSVTNSKKFNIIWKLDHFVVVDGDKYSRKEVSDFQKYLLKHDKLYPFANSDKHPYLAPLFSPYNIDAEFGGNDKPWSVAVDRDRRGENKYTKLLDPVSDNRYDVLKWLDVQQNVMIGLTGDDSKHTFENIPYIPDLLGSKLLEICMFIESSVLQGKNVMVYHPETEILRALQRAMIMRKHKYRNGDLKNGKEWSAKRSAKIRFSRMNEEYRHKQNTKFKYDFTKEELVDDTYRHDTAIIEQCDILEREYLKYSNYRFFYKSFESNWKMAKKRGLETLAALAASILDFAEYAHSPPSKTNVEEYRAFLKHAVDFKRIKLQPSNYAEIETQRLANETYDELLSKEKKEYEQIAFDICSQLIGKPGPGDILKPAIIAEFVLDKDLGNKTNLPDSVKETKRFTTDLEWGVTEIEKRCIDYFASKWRGAQGEILGGALRIKHGDAKLISFYFEHKKCRCEKDFPDLAPLNMEPINEIVKQNTSFFNMLNSSTYEKGFKVSLEQKEYSVTSTFNIPLKTNDDFVHFIIRYKAFFKTKLNIYMNGTDLFTNEREIETLATDIVEFTESPLFKKIKKTLNINGTDISKDDVLRLKMIWTGMSEENSINFAMIEGNAVIKKDYDKFTTAFAEGYIDCMFLSNAGIEGVDYSSCSPSVMICIDPVQQPGKRDQFNGRTVRKNSHSMLPVHMRKVEAITFVTTPRTKPTSTSTINIDLSIEEITTKLKKNDLNDNSRVLLEKTKRYRLGELKIEKQEKELTDEYDRHSKTIMSYIDQVNGIAERKLPKEQKYTTEEYANMVTYSRKLNLKTGNYDLKLTEVEFEEFQNQWGTLLKNADWEMIWGCKYDENADNVYIKGVNSNDQLVQLLKGNTGCVKALTIINAIIQKLNSELGNDYAPKTFVDFITDSADLTEYTTSNATWDRKVDNYVNISHVPCTKNRVFLSLRDYNYANNFYDLSKYRCHFCQQEVELIGDRCGNCSIICLKNGKPVYYELIRPAKQPDSSKIRLRNSIQKEKADNNRLFRDRMDMALSLVSLETKVNSWGTHEHRLDIIDDDGRPKQFYKHCEVDYMVKSEETGGWQDLIKSPSREHYKETNRKIKEYEKANDYMSGSIYQDAQDLGNPWVYVDNDPDKTTGYYYKKGNVYTPMWSVPDNKNPKNRIFRLDMSKNEITKRTTNYRVNDVAYTQKHIKPDGNCMYYAILQDNPLRYEEETFMVTGCGNAPADRTNVNRLRRKMYYFIGERTKEDLDLPSLADSCVGNQDHRCLRELKESIQRGIMNPGTTQNWGGYEELRILELMFPGLKYAIKDISGRLIVGTLTKEEGKIYLLYTGTHYDRLVPVEPVSVPVEPVSVPVELVIELEY
jgi:hypothetical protein